MVDYTIQLGITSEGVQNMRMEILAITGVVLLSGCSYRASYEGDEGKIDIRINDKDKESNNTSAVAPKTKPDRKRVVHQKMSMKAESHNVGFWGVIGAWNAGVMVDRLDSALGLGYGMSLLVAIVLLAGGIIEGITSYNSPRTDSVKEARHLIVVGLVLLIYPQILIIVIAVVLAMLTWYIVIRGFCGVAGIKHVPVIDKFDEFFAHIM